MVEVCLVRYFLDITYRGTNYHGWQNQQNAISIQEEIETACKKILGKPVSITGSGRTDTGVHAFQQIAHVDIDDEVDIAQLKYRLNSLLSKDISINDIVKVTPTSHARFDAEKRSYIYQIHKDKSPFKVGVSYYFRKEIDLDEIRKACTVIKEWRDFESLSKVQTEVNHFNCEIFSIEWRETNDGYEFFVCANRFLRGMVRTMVGLLLDEGASKLSLDNLISILEQRDRRAASRAVPAEGLFLSEVVYPEHIYIK